MSENEEELRYEIVRVCTYQGRRTRGIVRRLSSSDQDRGHLVPGKVACVEMSLHNGSQKPLLVLQLGRYCLLLRTAVGALLHSSQNPGLLALGHTAESHRCKQKQHGRPTIRHARQTNARETNERRSSVWSVVSRRKDTSMNS